MSFRIAGVLSLGIFTGFRISASVAQLAEQRFCKPQVVGSNPSAGFLGGARRLRLQRGGYRSGQTGQTVNLLAHAFAGSNPAPPIARQWGWQTSRQRGKINVVLQSNLIRRARRLSHGVNLLVVNHVIDGTFDPFDMQLTICNRLGVNRCTVTLRNVEFIRIEIEFDECDGCSRE